MSQERWRTGRGSVPNIFISLSSSVISQQPGGLVLYEGSELVWVTIKIKALGFMLKKNLSVSLPQKKCIMMLMG